MTDPKPVVCTGDLFNQPPPRVGFNAWRDDALLREAVRREGGGWVEPRADRLGAFIGSERLAALARDANRHLPELRSHDRSGRRIDEVAFHPAYHELMREAFGAGCHALAWTADRPGRFVARAALNYLWNQGEQGTACPVTMTFASVAVLRNEPALASVWTPKVLAHEYDPRLAPIAAKRAATVGMAMTEKQGGSDLRATRTTARRIDDDHALLTGHKWFCSVPASDALLSLARTDDGITCFLVPRVLEDGRRNTLLVQRLKDKLGNRSNASSEIEYADAFARRVGAPGRGIATLIEMAHLTRFDIVVACAGMMRAMLGEALHFARHREAFGRRLVEQPLMRNVLADIALETEGALHLAMRLARTFDDEARPLGRVLTPIAKYWLCKRMPAVALEALECLGGCGYVEDWPLARLYREAPLNGVWEGSGNVICLDVLRSIEREPASLDALHAELTGVDPAIDAHLERTLRIAADRAALEANARTLVERLATASAAALMRRHAPGVVADLFIASRLGATGERAFGTLRATAGGAAFGTILARLGSP